MTPPSTSRHAAALLSSIRRVAVFCGSHNGNRVQYAQEAELLGRGIARAGVGLIYGGGRKGLMGALAQGAQEEGGEVEGVIIPSLLDKEAYLSASLHVAENLFARKEWMIRRADAFIALPGGVGTLDELLEVLAHFALGFHDKPIGIVNVDEFYRPWLECMLEFSKRGFFHKRYLNQITVAPNSKALLRHWFGTVEDKA